MLFVILVFVVVVGRKGKKKVRQRSVGVCVCVCGGGGGCIFFFRPFVYRSGMEKGGKGRSKMKCAFTCYGWVGEGAMSIPIRL